MTLGEVYLAIQQWSGWNDLIFPAENGNENNDPISIFRNVKYINICTFGAVYFQ